MHPALLAAFLLSTPQLIIEPPDPVMIGIEVVPAFATTVLVHEIGHAIAASAMRLEVQEFKPYPTLCGTDFALGCVTTKKEPSKQQRLLLSSAGILHTRFSAEIIDRANRFIPDRHDRVKQFMSVLYFVMRLDMPRYVLFTAAKQWTGMGIGSSNDVHSFVTTISPRKRDKNLIYAGLTLTVVVDMILDWDELKSNWDTMRRR